MPICIIKHKKEGQNENRVHAESAQLVLGPSMPRSRGVAPWAGQQTEGQPHHSAPELLPATATYSSQQCQELPGSGTRVPDLGTAIPISMPQHGDSALGKPMAGSGVAILTPLPRIWSQNASMIIPSTDECCSWVSCLCTQKKCDQLA